MASPAIDRPSGPGERIAHFIALRDWPGSPITILPAVLLFYAVLLPMEMRLTIVDQNLYPTRIVALALIPWILWRLPQRAVMFRVWDFLFFLACFWMVLAFSVYYGPAEGLRRGGILAFDAVMPYLVGRLCFRSITDLRRFLVLIAPGLFLAGGTLLMEVVLGRPIIRPIAAGLFGEVPAYEGGTAVGAREIVVDRRLGILRATGPFPHPILAGVLLSSFLPLYALSGLRRWPLFVGACSSFFAVLSASSAAFLGLFIGAALFAVDAVQRSLDFISWKLIVPASILGLFLLHLLTERGLIPFLTRFTLDPRTASFRRMVWDYGTQSVEKHPWFGIGFSSYEKPIWVLTSSVDNHWLLLAMRFGVVPVLAIIAVAIGSIVAVSYSAQWAKEQDRRLHVGVAIAILIVTLLGFSVAFFGGAGYWVYMLFAIGVSIGADPGSVYQVMVPKSPPLSRAEQGGDAGQPFRNARG